jgi:nitrilase
VVEPVFDREELLVSTLDLDKIDRELMTFDVSGHYARPDLFRLKKNRWKLIRLDLIASNWPNGG